MASDMPIHSNGHPAPEEATPVLPAPPWLRIGRAAIGITLLALAWGAVMLAFLLGAYVVGAAPHQSVGFRLILYLAGATGALWLVVMALGALIAGAFCLTLALTTRHW